MACRRLEMLQNSHRTVEQGFSLGQAVGGLQQAGQVVEVRGDGGMLRPVGGFVDGQGAAAQRFGLDKGAFLRQKQPELIHQASYQLVEASLAGPGDDDRNVRTERLPAGPGAHVLRRRILR